MISHRLKRLRALFEFSLHSVPQAYGHVFMRRIILRYPLHTLRAFWKYWQTQGTESSQQRSLSCDSEGAFIHAAARDGERLLVATGFCQKPLHAAPQKSRPASTAHPPPMTDTATGGGDYDCPAGRFNHDCLYLSRLELGSPRKTQHHPACAVCPIRVLGHAALGAGASFAVLTSALDIARDILLPALDERRFARVLLAICPYSMEPISLALLICGLESHLFPYAIGPCTNYEQWLRADRGDKPQQTALAPPSTARLLHLLKAVAVERSQHSPSRPTRYQQVGHVFRPV